MTTARIPRNIKKLPLIMAGSNKFGRYPKISSESTTNMFVSDDWLVPTPGHLKIVDIEEREEGRGIFASTRGNFLLIVVGNTVWGITNEIAKFGRSIPVGDFGEQIANKIGTIETFTGDVFIDENNAEQVAICDKKDIYIYDYSASTFQKADTTDFIPGYVAFQDTYFIASVLGEPKWRLSAPNNGLSWPLGGPNEGEFETKTDNVQACIRVPGKGNQLFVMGSTVTESWNDIGYKIFPYYRTNSFNIDYGCLNPATIATSDKFVVWLGGNEKSRPVIMVSDGGPSQQISTDGINFQLSLLSEPTNAYGFLWKSDGHLFYHLTFPTDEVTYIYDFNTGKFYFLSDENLHNHIAKKVVFFANDYYFISLVDGDVYRISQEYTTYNGATIPRQRVTNTIRFDDGGTFIGNALGFVLEEGENTSISRIDTSLSYDGGVSFGNIISHELNPLGHRQNKFVEYDLGYANELTAQFAFWGEGRFICKDGYLEVYR